MTMTRSEDEYSVFEAAMEYLCQEDFEGMAEAMSSRRRQSDASASYPRAARVSIYEGRKQQQDRATFSRSLLFPNRSQLVKNAAWSNSRPTNRFGSPFIKSAFLSA